MAKLFYQIKNAVKKALPSFLLDWYHFALALSAALVFGFPSRKIKVIGITGTSGKSTVVKMASGIFEQAGYKTASLSSINFCIGGREEPNNLRMTLPGRFFVQKFLRKAVAENCAYVFLEVTSEGIKQFRHCFIDFELVAFTNLSPEHIESHGSFEKYLQAKQKLFQAVKKIHVVNYDDENFSSFSKFPALKKYLYGIGPIPDLKAEIIKAENLRTSNQGISFVVNGIEFELSVLGEFNVSNALAAIAIALAQGIDIGVCGKSLAKFRGVPGRMEKVIEKPFDVFVDYAITPNALEKVYATLVKNHHRLICVLGSCGGGRDKWKRPVLGKIAAGHCDQIILTNEDPYDENPQEIIDQVAQGVASASIDQLNQHKSAAYKIIDRRKAINKALSLAQPGDAVIITGKGCEPSMCLAQGQRISWDDRRAVREEFHKLQKRRDRVKAVVYETLPHAADFKIKVFGKNREALFKNALLAMTEIMRPKLSGENSGVRKIDLKSIDQAVLLIDFLNEALCLIQTNKEIYSKIKFRKFTDREIEADLVGQKLENCQEDIKAATYHDLEVGEKNGVWEATVLFDV